RLALPFYLYLVIHGMLIFLLPSFFEGLELKRDITSILLSFTFFAGTSTGWLPLLFIQMMLLFPFLTYLWKRKIYLYLYVFFAGCATFYFTFFSFPYEYYRLVMWFPWSLVMLL